VIVWKDGTAPLKSAEDLAGKIVHVRKTSTYFGSLQALNAKLSAAGKPEVSIAPVAEEWETDTVLESVSRGENRLHHRKTICLANIHIRLLDNLVVGPPITRAVESRLGGAAGRREAQEGGLTRFFRACAEARLQYFEKKVFRG